MKCTICQKEGHRSDNRRFHQKSVDKRAEPIVLPKPRVKQSSNTSVQKPPMPIISQSENARKFIETAKLQHSIADYDYSFVQYKNCDTQVSIWCNKPNHGMFQNVPYNHLKHNVGCPKCRKEKKWSDEAEEKRVKFIEKAKLKHPAADYDYSLVSFENITDRKVIIVCTKGHTFTQEPSNHLSGAGCRLCGIKKTAETRCKTQSKFISDAITKYGDLYDYSDTIYTSSDEFIIITCKKEGHPQFSCKATYHLSGQGCPLCSKEQISNSYMISLEEFIERSNLVHDVGKYDYSESIYTGRNSVITIYCNTHMESFTQLAGYHMNGSGCKKCGIAKRNLSQTFTKEEFISRAKEVHGDMFDYSAIIYKNSQTKIEINCKTHGGFIQVPNSHLQGYGCNKCAITKNAEKHRLTLLEFIEKANHVHKHVYDYSLVNYISMAIKIHIKCKTCENIFTQTPNNHISKGFGCPYCAGNAILTTNEFIERAHRIHGLDRYDYSKSIYNRSSIQLSIVCKNSNKQFEQTPNSHLRGSGCPCCKPKYSKPQILFLECVRVKNPSLQHALNDGEHIIIGSRYRADGYIPEMNHVIEFHGCLWHGCPRCFSQIAMNPCTKRTFGEEYERTMVRKRFIENAGYLYTEVWECDWNRAVHAVIKIQQRWKAQSNT